jgi:hypothetical protein
MTVILGTDSVRAHRFSIWSNVIAWAGWSLCSVSSRDRVGNDRGLILHQICTAVLDTLCPGRSYRCRRAWWW